MEELSGVLAHGVRFGVPAVVIVEQEARERQQHVEVGGAGATFPQLLAVEAMPLVEMRYRPPAPIKDQEARAGSQPVRAAHETQR